MTRKILWIAAPLLIVLTTATAPLAASGSATEVPETLRKQVLRTIGEYVEQDIARKQQFLLLDPRTGKPLVLTFDHVHQGVKPHGDAYLACVDFRGPAGSLYDVDVVVDVSKEEPEVTEVFLHKVDGEKVDRNAP